jgi:cytochrome c biogenesis protein CcmG/thiol:disulfide interchange protein DsbE
MRGSSYRILAMVLIGVGLLVLGVVSWIALPKAASTNRSSGERSVIPVEVEFPAPELTLTDLQGNPVSLTGYLGHIVLVNNWATWCPPCKAEMPILQDYYDEHRHQEFTIIAIEAGEPVFEVADFVKQYGLSFVVWPDPTQSATVAFRNPALPSSYLIDRTGMVRLAWTGAIDRESLDKYITPFVEE